MTDVVTYTRTEFGPPNALGHKFSQSHPVFVEHILNPFKQHLGTSFCKISLLVMEEGADVCLLAPEACQARMLHRQQHESSGLPATEHVSEPVGQASPPTVTAVDGPPAPSMPKILIPTDDGLDILPSEFEPAFADDMPTPPPTDPFSPTTHMNRFPSVTTPSSELADTFAEFVADVEMGFLAPSPVLSHPSSMMFNDTDDDLRIPHLALETAPLEDTTTSALSNPFRPITDQNSFGTVAAPSPQPTNPVALPLSPSLAPTVPTLRSKNPFFFSPPVVASHGVSVSPHPFTSPTVAPGAGTESMPPTTETDDCLRPEVIPSVARGSLTAYLNANFPAQFEPVSPREAGAALAALHGFRAFASTPMTNNAFGGPSSWASIATDARKTDGNGRMPVVERRVTPFYTGGDDENHRLNNVIAGLTVPTPQGLRSGTPEMVSLACLAPIPAKSN